MKSRSTGPARMSLLKAAILWGIIGLAFGVAQASPGLLLIAHGSPSKEWNGRILDLGREVEALNAKTRVFGAVRVAFLEMAEPDPAGAVAELEKSGCDRIVAVPLFIAPSGHTHFDVPAALGIYYSPQTADSLAEEHSRPASPRVPIILTHTLAESDLLCSSTLDRVRALSRSPASEALVLLAHGDPDHAHLWCGLARRVASFCCGRTGIAYADWAFVGMGGGAYGGRAVPTILEALRHRRRVLVVGLYVGVSAERLNARYVERLKQRGEKGPFEGKEVVFSRKPLLPDARAAGEILRIATEALAGADGGKAASHRSN